MKSNKTHTIQLPCQLEDSVYFLSSNINNPFGMIRKGVVKYIEWNSKEGVVVSLDASEFIDEIYKSKNTVVIPPCYIRHDSREPVSYMYFKEEHFNKIIFFGEDAKENAGKALIEYSENCKNNEQYINLLKAKNILK